MSLITEGFGPNQTIITEGFSSSGIPAEVEVGDAPFLPGMLFEAKSPGMLFENYLLKTDLQAQVPGMGFETYLPGVDFKTILPKMEIIKKEVDE